MTLVLGEVGARSFGSLMRFAAEQGALDAGHRGARVEQLDAAARRREARAEGRRARLRRSSSRSSARAARPSSRSARCASAGCSRRPGARPTCSPTASSRRATTGCASATRCTRAPSRSCRPRRSGSSRRRRASPRDQALLDAQPRRPNVPPAAARARHTLLGGLKVGGLLLGRRRPAGLEGPREPRRLRRARRVRQEGGPAALRAALEGPHPESRVRPHARELQPEQARPRARPRACEGARGRASARGLGGRGDRVLHARRRREASASTMRRSRSESPAS